MRRISGRLGLGRHVGGHVHVRIGLGADVGIRIGIGADVGAGIGIRVHIGIGIGVRIHIGIGVRMRLSGSGLKPAENKERQVEYGQQAGHDEDEVPPGQEILERHGHTPVSMTRSPRSRHKQTPLYCRLPTPQAESAYNIRESL
jgi:hypothetical protein